MWERECEGYGGFARKFVDPTMCITHQEFVEKIMRSINKRITDAMNFCLENTEKMFMKARCALIILNRVAPVFPNQYDFAKRIQKKIDTLVNSGNNSDKGLVTLAERLNSELKKKIKSFPEYQKETAKREAQELEAKRAKDREPAASGDRNNVGSGSAVRRVNDHNSRSNADMPSSSSKTAGGKNDNRGNNQSSSSAVAKEKSN